MPDIRIQYREEVELVGMRRSYVYPERHELIRLLQEECAERFSVADWPLVAEDFSVYDEPLSGLSVQSHDIIIRITLHAFETRVLDGERNARELAAVVSKLLNNEQMVDRRGHQVTVGVSLVLAQIAWATS